MTAWQNTRVHFIGGGNMAAAMIGGLIANALPPAHISVSDANSEARLRLQSFGVKVSADNYLGLRDAQVVILAVKPQVVAQVLAELSEYWYEPYPLLLSIAAGIDVATLLRLTRSTLPVVRAMPNTPALIQQGATVLFASSQVNAVQRQHALAIASAIGQAWWVEEEALIDVVTAVSGSGPAYYFLLMEAMIQAAINLGLPDQLACELVVQTAMGSGGLAVQRFQQEQILPAQLRQQVTSPGGTTAAALEVLTQQQFPQSIQMAIQAAHARAVELKIGELKPG